MKVTMQAVADRAGVSKNAVSLALRHHPSIPEKTRSRIEKAAAELGYQRNPAYGELMSQMTRRGRGTEQNTIGLINANLDERAFSRHATVPNYVAGCQRRAETLNYTVDPLWMHAPDISGSRWLQILRTRNIRGLIIIGMMKENRIPKSFLPVVEAFPTVVTGVRTRQPALSFACVDHHILALRAFERALNLGYRRPGLVLDRVIDDLVDHRFSAGYRTGQLELPASRRLAPFFDVTAAKKHPARFKEWIRKEQPDVIFTLYNVVRDWLSGIGLKVPQDIGLIQLEWRTSRPEFAGMDQHNDVAGEAALDMLIGMIHRGENGIPQFPRATLIGPTWRDGETVRTQAAGRR